MKSLSLALVLAAGLAVASPTLAKDVQTATATFTGHTVAVGVGYTWGDGVLTFKGHAYPFKVKGLDAVGAGAEKITATAEIYNLKTAADFNGMYAAAQAGGSVGTKGGGTAVMHNDKGVTIRVHTQDKGLALSVAGSGVAITLAK
jgi:hypothetical protein